MFIWWSKHTALRVQLRGRAKVSVHKDPPYPLSSTKEETSMWQTQSPVSYVLTVPESNPLCTSPIVLDQYSFGEDLLTLLILFWWSVLSTVMQSMCFLWTPWVTRLSDQEERQESAAEKDQHRGIHSSRVCNRIFDSFKFITIWNYLNIGFI